MDDDSPKPNRKTVATESSIDKAGQIADALGLPFDPDQVAANASQLKSLYFRDIQSVLVDETKDLLFDEGRLATMEAFAAPIKQSAHIVIDDFVDFWLQDLNFLVTYVACFQLKEDERTRITKWVRQRLDWRKDISEAEHQAQRDALWPYFLNYADVLMVANALTLTQLAYIICHEIAHTNLGHLKESDSRFAMELEADELAFEYVLKVHQARHQLPHLQIDDSVLGAPGMSLLYLSHMSQITHGHDQDTQTYASFTTRMDALHKRWSAHFPDSSHQKYNVLTDLFRTLAH